MYHEHLLESGHLITVLSLRVCPTDTRAALCCAFGRAGRQASRQCLDRWCVRKRLQVCKSRQELEWLACITSAPALLLLCCLLVGEIRVPRPCHEGPHVFQRIPQCSWYQRLLARQYSCWCGTHACALPGAATLLISTPCPDMVCESYCHSAIRPKGPQRCSASKGGVVAGFCRFARSRVGQFTPSRVRCQFKCGPGI
jgi:hypothetical protein